MTCQNILSQQIDVYKNAQGHMETVLTKLEAKIKEINDKTHAVSPICSD